MSDDEERVCINDAVPGSEIVKLILSRLRVEDSGEQGLILHWQDIVGKTLAEHVRIYERKYDTLVLIADHPAWNQKFEFSKKRILKRINADYPKLLVKSIQIITK
ncbi:MAG: DUF721 domain-containing protein [Spirochaetia bacterium]|jgi:predicted nucleic acid-binding Zn ribbon protein|nr:DUF721 domain-containing protein [Spirochaetia bacterium]